MDQEQFHDHLRKILNHLSDAAFLESEPDLLRIFLTEDEAHQPNHLQLLRVKIGESIHALNPPENVPLNAPEWRSSRALAMRYLNGMKLYRIEEELGLSPRQVQRELKKGVEALASILYKRAPVQIEEAAADPNQDELSDSSDMEVLKKELMSWDTNFSFNTLSQIIQQAVHLCEFLSKSDLTDRLRYDEVDPELSIMVDPILTKQGLYKIFSVLVADNQNSTIHMLQRPLNDHFIELTIRISHSQPLAQNSLEIAKLFFTVQGINEAIWTQQGQTSILLHLPLLTQGKCLVIDDVGSVRVLIERMLSPYGIQVFGADHPNEALSLAQLMTPNFILLDILMPKMDGWELIGNLKQSPETKSIPVIICSALNEPDLARAVGAAGYIRKPIDRLELIHTLQQAGLIMTSPENNLTD
jgi:CheY-like chemotaxis protein